LGYYDAFFEITGQAKSQGFTPDHIVLCSGSGGTHAGILAAAFLDPSAVKVTGIMVSPEVNFAEEISHIANETAKLAGHETKISPGDVILKEYIGPGYAKSSEEGAIAIRYLAEKEGIFLDPVYTGKAFAGFLDLHKRSYFIPGENVVFLHSGGLPALFAIPL
jgi:1-aminocyclopropane-1-carboxylate deaminase/D-cysteine desulfhydrase-like pyridoxal-dependent ACC family enzyme